MVKCEQDAIILLVSHGAAQNARGDAYVLELLRGALNSAATVAGTWDAEYAVIFTRNVEAAQEFYKVIVPVPGRATE